jgi:hypothetical protein
MITLENIMLIPKGDIQDVSKNSVAVISRSL